MTTYVYRKKRKYPPGPLGIPLIGSLPSVTINPTQFHSYLARRYGPITYYQYGFRDRIIINDYKVAKLILNRDDFMNRPHYFDFKFRHNSKSTISESDRYGQSLCELDSIEWKKRRRFYHLILMRMLSGKFIDETLEFGVKNFILPKMDQLTDLKQPWQMKKYLHQSILNNIFMLLFGEGMYVNDPVFDRVSHLLDEYSRLVHKYQFNMINSVVTQIPFLQTITNKFNLQFSGLFFFSSL